MRKCSQLKHLMMTYSNSFAITIRDTSEGSGRNRKSCVVTVTAGRWAQGDGPSDWRSGSHARDLVGISNEYLYFYESNH